LQKTGKHNKPRLNGEKERHAMKIISIINLKGGVGKTFTSYNMAHELGKRGYKVLVLDNDKQGNISKAFGHYCPMGECEAAKALTGKYKNPLRGIIKECTQQNNIDLIPANMSLMQAVSDLYTATGNQITGYEQLINTPIGFNTTIKYYYDFMIIDNPPDIAFNVAAALKITDEVIIPVKIDEWALEGLDIMAEQIDEAKAINPDIKLLGALVTMYRNDDTNIAGLEWLEKKSPVKLLAKIRYTDKAAESTFFNKPVYEYSPRCGAAQDYKNFITEYLRKAGV
jgi:chromosome partitioning protein